jgi:hypothetical protein
VIVQAVDPANPITAGVVTNTATISVGAYTDIYPIDNSSSVQTTIARALIYLTKSSVGEQVHLIFL